MSEYQCDFGFQVHVSSYINNFHSSTNQPNLNNVNRSFIIAVFRVF
jgi:hypothetical protein